MNDKLFGLIFSGLLIVNGIFVVVLPKPTIRRYFMSEYETDLTDVKWIVGPVLIGIGLVFFSKTYKRKFGSPVEKSYHKCISCGNVIEVSGDPEFKCRECRGYIEPLKGFFERHPEFKDD